MSRSSLLKKILSKTEWYLTSALLVFLFMIVALAKIRAKDFRKVTNEPLVTIEIQGCVYKPGCFSVVKGTCFSEVLRKAKPKKFADLSGITLTETMQMNRMIQIPFLSEICCTLVFDGGESIPLTVPVGTRICDLKKLPQLRQRIDPAEFKSRRKLNPGEQIKIKQR